MKTKSLLAKCAALILLSTLIYQPSTASAQGTAFTYQGRLFDNTNPANGSYAIRFTVYDGSNTLNVVAMFSRENALLMFS